MGDVHCEFGLLNTFINKKRPAMILQCGDFGFWPNMTAKDHLGVTKEKKRVIADETKIYWCDGNHEDHSTLNALESNEIYPNVFHMKRGAMLALPDGRKVLFVGGAKSTDRDHRTAGYDWFPGEEISLEDVRGLPEASVDIVISHTCPREFHVLGDDMRLNDNCRMALSYVLHKYRPGLWYFGHFHYYQTGETHGCRWTGLTMAGYPDWWEKLPIGKAK